MIVIYLKLLLIIYITKLYHRKISTFYTVQRRNFGKKTPISLYEKKTGWRQWTLVLIFCVDVHMGLDPSPVHMRPPELDVINRWPLRERTVHPPSYAVAKKIKSLTLHTHGCLRASLRD